MKKQSLILVLLMSLLFTAHAASHAVGCYGAPAGCARPYGVQLVSMTDGSARLVWQGNAEKYDYLCVRQEDMAALNIVSQGVFVDDTAVTLTGLRPGGVYCFRVRGHCGGQTSAWSQDFYFRTWCGPQKLPYSETFEACSGTGLTALPSCWAAYYVMNDTAFIQSGATNVYPVTQSAIKGKKSLALKEESVEGTLVSRKRSYVAMPQFATTDSLVQLSFDAAGVGNDTVRLLVGLTDRTDDIGLMEAADTMVLSSKKQHYDTVLPAQRLTGRHIVFCNIGGVRQPMTDHYTLLIDNVQLRKVAGANHKPPYCPHPLVAVKKENVTMKSALVTWNDVGSRYELQWKEQSSSKWSKSVSLNTNSYSLTGLKQDTRYMVRVRNVCKAGMYSVWASAGFVTKAPAYCPYPYVSVGEANTTEHSALVAWDGENDSYELQWKKESSSAWSKAVSLNGYSYVISGLEPKTRYEVQVRGVCDGKDYSTWTPASFVTKAHTAEPEPSAAPAPAVAETSEPCPEVEDFRVVGVGSGGIRLEWMGRTNTYAFEVVGYDEYHLPRNVIRSEVSLGSAATSPTAAAPHSCSYSLNELTPDKDYEVRIRTRCADDSYGGWSEKVSFHTMAEEDTISSTDTIDADDIPTRGDDPEDEDTVYYTLTEKGVDILQIGKPFVKNPPAGAIYDKAVLASKGDNGGMEYQLLKNGVEIGYAIVSDRVLIGLVISHPSVMTEGGITVNTPIVEAFTKKMGVSSECVWYTGFDEVYIELYLVGDKKIWTLRDVDDLSSSGRQKYNRIYQEGQNYNPWSDENFGVASDPKIKLKSSDFKKTATVKELRVGKTVFMCW